MLDWRKATGGRRGQKIWPEKIWKKPKFYPASVLKWLKYYAGAGGATNPEAITFKSFRAMKATAIAADGTMPYGSVVEWGDWSGPQAPAQNYIDADELDRIATTREMGEESSSSESIVSDTDTSSSD